jgi:hypothetical protein
MRKTFILVALAPILLHSQTRGTFDFLRMDVSARASALNSSFISMVDDPNLLFYNPAALSTLSRPKASAGYLKHLLDVHAGSLSYGQLMEQLGSIGVGITFIDYGSITETDESLNTLGTFGALELALVVGWSIEMDDETSLGASIKGISSSIASYSSRGLAVDVGILHRIPTENIAVAVVVANIGGQLKSYAGVREQLPLDVKLGITKRPEHLPVFLNVNFNKLNEKQETFLQRLGNFNVGAEFLMSESVRLRVGYSNEKRKEMKLGTSAGLAGFSLGGGILFQDYVVDYAFNSYGKIGGLHRISVGMSF